MAMSRIQRGYACVPCHTRKKRCDGARPSCRTCTRSHIECEYSDIPGEVSNHRQIRSLLTRVDELERILINMGGRASPPNVGSPALGSGSGSGSSSGPSAPGSEPANSPGVDPVSGEIAPWLQDFLLATMRANGRRYNLYFPLSTLERPPPPILVALNLVACHVLTPSSGQNTRPSLQEIEMLKPLLLSKVYSGIHTSLENACGLLVGAVCAPALASQYLMEVGRFAEAQWLASNAIRFAVSSGIHNIVTHWPTSPNTPEQASGVGSSALLPPVSNTSFLVPPRSHREHQQRLMSWWLAYAADGMVEVVTGLPSALRAEILVCLGDTEARLGGTTGIPVVFPLPESLYEAEPSERDERSVNISSLLFGDNAQDASSGSVFACLLKALTFYHAAAAISDCSSTGRSIEPNTSARVFRSISAFTNRASESHARDLELASACMIAHLAVIRLYASSLAPEEQQRRRAAALGIAALVPNLSAEEIYARSQLIEKCCTEALQVLSSEEARSAISVEDLGSLSTFVEQLRQRNTVS